MGATVSNIFYDLVMVPVYYREAWDGLRLFLSTPMKTESLDALGATVSNIIYDLVMVPVYCRGAQH